MDPRTTADAAADAARASGVTVRLLTEPVEHQAAQDLFIDLWATEPVHAPVSADLLAALSHFGGYVAGAYSGETLVGAAAGFRGADPEPSLHSHITGVRPDWQGRRVGYAIKLHQRVWALEHGITAINWTFDPLIRRNAFFNITRLGARPQRYLVDLYGEMRDGVNAGQGSDRILVTWPVTADALTRSEPDVGDLRPDRVLLDTDAGGGPEWHPPPADADADASEAPLLCRVPADIETLRRSDPALAMAWRTAVRETLGGRMAAGHPITGMTRSGWYVVGPR